MAHARRDKDSVSGLGQLKSGAHVHLMGICGVAMASLAGLLRAQGFQVTGSDQNVYPPMSTQVEAMGIAIMNGYRAENLSPAPDFVIVGNVISASNPEAQEMARLGLPFTSLAAAIGELVIGHRQSLVIAGTHGKTTSTALAAHVWTELGLEPGFLIGGVPRNFPASYQLPKGNWFVIEGDEYDTAYFDKGPKFLHYRAQSLILTSIEFDHADIYKDLDAVLTSFRRLLDGLTGSPPRLAFAADDARVLEVLERTGIRAKGVEALCFALDRSDLVGPGLSVVRSEVLAGGTRFSVQYPDGAVLDVVTELMGDYNIKNILGVLAMAELHSMARDKVVKAVSLFRGVKRRQEFLGEPGGRRVFEDFAHHPTAVKMTLDLLRARKGNGRLMAVFEPRSATSRRRVFQEDYARVFAGADAVFLARPFNQASIPESDRFSSDELAGALCERGVQAQAFASVDDIITALAESSQSGDVIVIMSNGGFDGIYEKLIRKLAES